MSCLQDFLLGQAPVGSPDPMQLKHNLLDLIRLNVAPGKENEILHRLGTHDLMPWSA